MALWNITEKDAERLTVSGNRLTESAKVKISAKIRLILV